MVGSWVFRLVFTLVCLMVPGIAKSAVLYTYSGWINRIEYNDTAPDTLSPFTVGEVVFAELVLPVQGAGRFIVGASALFIDGVPQFGSGLGAGRIQFGSPDERIVYTPGDVTLAVVANFPKTASTPLIDHVDFCCVLQPPWFQGGENGQAVFSGDDFWAMYLPTGQTNINVTAYGTGAWSARIIPEPAAAGMFGLAVIGLLMIASSPRHRSHRRPSP